MLPTLSILLFHVQRLRAWCLMSACAAWLVLPAGIAGAENATFEQFWADALKSKRADKSEAAQRRLEWWRDAKFGMFVHWGPSSVAASEISWSKQFYDDTGEHLLPNPRPGPGLYNIREHNEWLDWFKPAVPREVYDHLPRSFHPGLFDADAFVAQARQAGMKYIVQVAKHHDGFCMWDTKFSDFNVMHTPFQRDILGELARACDRAGLKFGIYYSQRDWHHPDYGRDRMATYNEFMFHQIKELLQQYPNISLIFFDAEASYPWKLWEADQLFRLIHELRPDIVINNRCGVPADYSTPEQKIGAFDIDRDWESCMTFTGFWSWHGFQAPVISFEECLQRLVRCAGGGGNLLMNVGPMPTGQMDPREADRLKRVGEWLEKYGASIYGTRAGPFKPGEYGVSTRKGNTIYVHILQWPITGPVVLPKIAAQLVGARQLGPGNVEARQSEAGLEISVSRKDRAPVDTVVALEFDRDVMGLPAVAAGDGGGGMVPGETIAQRDARMKWWRDARFGMFIHWGLYALPAGEWRGQRVPGNGEWIMNKARIPVADYAALAPQFNPVRFDATHWVRLAKSAGMKYIIITAKHHDGFALFNSAVDSFNIVTATPFRRDPLKELAAACAAEGIKLGFYYSQSQDWHHRGGAGNFWDASQSGDYDAYLDSVAVPQVRELLSNYGPVAVLWYDTPRHMTDRRAAKFLPLHALQPGLIVNNRLRTSAPSDGSTIGDTETPEQFIPPNGHPGKDWETCMTMNETWGFKADDDDWKDADDLIRKLSDIASKGGNFLLNVGPTALGEIPEPSVERLHAVGAWLQRNGDAIYGTQAGPFVRRPPWGRATRRGNALHLHIWDWPADGKLLLPGVRQLPKQAEAVSTPEGIVVQLPPGPTDRPVSIVRLEFDRPVTSSQTLPTVGLDGCIALTAADAQVNGGEISGDVVKVTSQWNLQYSLATPAEKTWRVSAELSSSAYNRINVSVPGPFGRSTTTALQAWGRGADDFVTVQFGALPLEAGVHTLVFKSEMEDLRPLQIRRVYLTPQP